MEENNVKSKDAETDNKQVNIGDPIYVKTYMAVSKFKSIRRAMRRGHVTMWGIIVPKRPFNNRKRTPGREQQLKQERLYGEYINKDRF